MDQRIKQIIENAVTDCELHKDDLNNELNNRIQNKKNEAENTIIKKEFEKNNQEKLERETKIISEFNNNVETLKGDKERKLKELNEEIDKRNAKYKSDVFYQIETRLTNENEKNIKEVESTIVTLKNAIL